MKKLALAVFAAVLLAGSAFAVGEINVKAGLDVGGLDVSNDQAGVSTLYTDTMDGIGISLGAEFLIAVNEAIKLGAGVQYLVPRDTDKGTSQLKDWSFADVSYLPIYATIQLSPIRSNRAIYFKGNLGYNVISGGTLLLKDKEAYKSEFSKDNKGGFYLGFGAGYDFPFGLIIELSYDIYNSDVNYSYKSYYDNYDLSYSKVGITAGYKFKL